MSEPFTAPVGEKRELIPAKSYQAVCYALIDLGTHETPFGESHKIYMTFEIPGLRIEYERDGEKLEGPKVIGKEFTWSMHEKSNLRKAMESWRGKPFTELQAKDFDFTKLLGVNCTIQIMHGTSKKGNEYAYINAILPLMDGMEEKKAENPHLFFTFRKPFVDETGFHWPENLPEWIQNKIKESKRPTAHRPGTPA